MVTIFAAELRQEVSNRELAQGKNPIVAQLYSRVGVAGDQNRWWLIALLEQGENILCHLRHRRVQTVKGLQVQTEIEVGT